jgi:hypothetical protein
MALLGKDALAFSREKFYIGISVLSLVLFVAAFWLIPDRSEPGLVIGVSGQGLAPLEAALAEESAKISLYRAGGEAELRAIHSGELVLYREGAVLIARPAGESAPEGAERQSMTLGLALPDGFPAASAAPGEASEATLFLHEGASPAMVGMVRAALNEAAYAAAGRAMPVAYDEAQAERALGSGQEAPGPRDAMRPMLVFFAMMMETFALAALLATEVSRKTLLALVVSPASQFDVLLAKSIYGTLLVLGQAAVLLAATASLSAASWHVVLLAALLGALLFNGIALFVGSFGKDFISTLMLTMALVLPLAVPGISSLFPGATPGWIKAFPTYGILDTLREASVRGAGIEAAPGLLPSLAWVAALFGLGLTSLSRKVVKL